ncbi:hypothetical protein BDR06DRAFT_947568 [Suillus hirtellus]|nr:hypothetical protein BDR06DRAFT_947568 [Suillus hirtellus]
MSASLRTLLVSAPNFSCSLHGDPVREQPEGLIPRQDTPDPDSFIFQPGSCIVHFLLPILKVRGASTLCHYDYELVFSQSYQFYGLAVDKRETNQSWFTKTSFR